MDKNINQSPVANLYWTLKAMTQAAEDAAEEARKLKDDKNFKLCAEDKQNIKGYRNRILGLLDTI